MVSEYQAVKFYYHSLVSGRRSCFEGEVFEWHDWRGIEARTILSSAQLSSTAIEVCFGPGCVKTPNLKIFVGKVTNPITEKRRRARFDRPIFLKNQNFYAFPHSLGR